jgi:hypothetical protein
VETSEIYGRMVVQYGSDCMSHRKVYEWIRTFEDNTSDVDDAHSGWPEADEFHPHLTIIYLRSILILFSHPSLGLLSDCFPQGFAAKMLYTRFISPLLATCPTHFIILD